MVNEGERADDIRRSARVFGGVVAIGGGIAGIGTIPPLIGRSSSLLFYLIVGLATLFYIFGVVAGIRLFENRPGAAKLLSWFLWLQVPVLQSSMISYAMSAIGSVSLIWRGALMMDISMGLTSAWTVSLFSVPDQFGLGINALPLIFLAVFWMLQKARLHT